MSASTLHGIEVVRRLPAAAPINDLTERDPTERRLTESGIAII